MTVERFSHTPKFAGIASDVVAVPIADGRKMLFLSGVAAERPDGQWLSADAAAGDIHEQLKFVWNRIGELLGFHGGRYADIVKVVIYTTDARYKIDPVGTYLKTVFQDGPVPAITGVTVTALAWPELLLEIDITAVV